ncbi:hypothetical protein JCM4814A_09350 [Streptomyces phaeofaciens JCM 4814]|uniref:Uncharacterized protein n=1 Tax=Streptomyces phaeofaciens TaxID=68254 RepID=A0A918M1V9_9ACTN|nr:hypothetical protein GCM10010226_91600 [Streptomyces phaeofaciens]
MVPLAEAWDSGASQWTATRREAYANDLDVATSINRIIRRSTGTSDGQKRASGPWRARADERHGPLAGVRP